MKPNFALSLSFSGIRLLHRGNGGWHIVGEVDVASPRLGEELAQLRQHADALSSTGVYTKLIIPNDQIRYLAIETGQKDTLQRSRLAKAALEGTTPYQLDELAFSVSANGPVTYVAAVARETLNEAEAFAVEHDFAPVSWVARPKPNDFIGEPFFGQTASATAAIGPSAFVEADLEAIRILKGPPVAETKIPPAPPPIEKTPRSLVLGEGAAMAPAPDKPATDQAAAQNAAGVTVLAASRTPPPALASEEGAVQTGNISQPSPAATPRSKGRIAALLALPCVALGVWALFFMEGPAPQSQAPESRPQAALAPQEPAPQTSLQPLTEATEDSAPPASAEIPQEPAQSAPDQMPDTIPAPLPPSSSPVDSQSAQSGPVMPAPEGLTSEDAAVLDALRDATPQAPQTPRVSSPEFTMQELLENYATSGIWPQAPEALPPVGIAETEDYYIAGIDPVSPANDAVALPDPRGFDTDQNMADPSAPLAAGTSFDLDENGLVRPRPEGSLTPDGITVYLGRPFTVPPLRPDFNTEEAGTDPALEALSKLRPRVRPQNLLEENERSNNGGLSRSELSQFRPQNRPASVLIRLKAREREAEAAQAAEKAAQEAAAQAAIEDARNSTRTPQASEPVQPENPQAVKQSVRPDSRPRNFNQKVKRAQREETGRRVAAVATATVKPKVPSKASVAKNATVKNAIKLGRVNLIGVFGKTSSRRALVRMPSGQIKRVKVGDRVDGGRVTAIGEGRLIYRKGSRSITLKMPKG